MYVELKHKIDASRRIWFENPALNVEIVMNQVDDSDGSNGKGKKEVPILNLKRANRPQVSFNLNELDIHGDVYFDAELGGITANLEGTLIAYIAEKKKPKNYDFFPVIICFLAV